MYFFYIKKHNFFCHPRCDSTRQFTRTYNPNWIHVLCVTSFFKYDHPHVTVSKNAHGNRKPQHLWCQQRTPEPLSLRGKLCCQLVCRAFHFTAHVYSDKMTIQSQRREAQLPQWLFHLTRKENAAWAANLDKIFVMSVSTCAFMHFFVQWVWSGFQNEREQPWGLHLHPFWLSNHAFPVSEIIEWEFSEQTASMICQPHDQPTLPVWLRLSSMSWQNGPVVSLFSTQLSKKTFTQKTTQEKAFISVLLSF